MKFSPFTHSPVELCARTRTRTHGIENHACELVSPSHSPGRLQSHAPWAGPCSSRPASQRKQSYLLSLRGSPAPQPPRDARMGRCGEGGLPPLLPQATEDAPALALGFCLGATQCTEPPNPTGGKEFASTQSPLPPTEMRQQGWGEDTGPWECSGHRRQRRSWPVERHIL